MININSDAKKILEYLGIGIIVCSMTIAVLLGHYQSNNKAITQTNEYVVNISVTNNTYNYTTTINNTLGVVKKEWIEHQRSIQCNGFKIEGSKTYTIQGMSMKPTLWPGYTVYTKKYDNNLPIMEGEVVVVTNPEGTSITHRIVGIYPDYIVLQGDNNDEPDDTKYSLNSIQNIVCAVTW